jgi:DNA-binding GntR family transcriptional regulator
VGTEPGTITRAHTVDEIAEALHRQVLSGELPIGSRIRQESIAQRFNVSRQPVREALRKLQATGIVDLEPNRGAVVRGPTLREVHELYEIRAELEGLAARRAAARAGRDLVRRLQQAQRAFVAAGARLGDLDASQVAWGQANDLFHEAVLDGADSHQLQQQVRQLHRTVPRNLTWASLAGKGELLQQSIDAHAAILEAIAARDEDGARSAMIAHVARAGELVAEEFARRGAAAE